MATIAPLVGRRCREALALLVRRQRVVLLEVAEGRLRPALRMRRHRRPGAAGVDAALRLTRHRSPILAWCCPCSARARSASPPSSPRPAWRWPRARARRRAARAARARRARAMAAPIASTTSASASKECPETSASQYGSAATIPPACTENARARNPRVDPDDAVGEPREPLHLPADLLGVAPLPAVGEDHDDGAAGHPAPAVAVVEGLQRVADPGAARPVRRRGRGPLDGALGAAGAQRPGEAGEPGREDERLGVRPAAGGAGQELQVGPGVGLHRARDVAQQDEPPADHPPLTAAQADRVAARAQAGAQRAAQVDPLRRAGPSGSGGVRRRGVASRSRVISS